MKKKDCDNCTVCESSDHKMTDCITCFEEQLDRALAENQDMKDVLIDIIIDIWRGKERLLNKS